MCVCFRGRDGDDLITTDRFASLVSRKDDFLLRVYKLKI